MYLRRFSSSADSSIVALGGIHRSFPPALTTIGENAEPSRTRALAIFVVELLMQSSNSDSTRRAQREQRRVESRAAKKAHYECNSLFSLLPPCSNQPCSNQLL